MSSPRSDASALADARLAHAYFRSLAGGRERAGPFTIQFAERSASPFANYAIPDDDADPSADNIASLVAAFVARRRVPRLEYVPTAAPKVEAALSAAGFAIDLRPPFMTRRPSPMPAVAMPDGFDLSLVQDEAALRDVVRVGRVAFGSPPIVGAINVTGEMRALECGRRFAAIYERASGQMAGCGSYMPPQAGVTEIVGIAVAKSFRRRGLGRAITDFLARAAFDAGCEMTFLSAAGEAQAAIYARAGFVARAPMLFISKPSQPED